MKTMIIKIVFILILGMNPIIFTKSSDINNKYDVNNEVNILKEIDKEYISFYTHLFQYDTSISINSNINNINFIIDIHEYAMKSDALPSVTIAQAILETGYGRSNKLKHNIFGIKGKGIKTKTKEFYNNKFVTIKSEFQSFNNYSEAFKRHYEIIGKYKYKNRDYKHWAHTIKESGYATDPCYAEKLIYIIEKHNLSKLDKIKDLKENVSSLNRIEYLEIS